MLKWTRGILGEYRAEYHAKERRRIVTIERDQWTGDWWLSITDINPGGGALAGRFEHSLRDAKEAAWQYARHERGEL